MTKQSIIVGYGGHGIVIEDILKLRGQKILGFVDDGHQKGDLKNNLECLGSVDIFLEQPINFDEYDFYNGIGPSTKNKDREELQKKFELKGLFFKTIIHKSAIISDSVQLKKGVQIFANSVIQPNTLIGQGTVINTSCNVDHDSRIGANAHLAPAVTCGGNVKIGNNSFIGLGTNILNNIEIGNNVLISSGSTIFQNIEDNVKIIQKKNIYKKEK